MAPRITLPLACAAALLAAAPAGAAEAPTLLDPVTHVLRAGAAADQSCEQPRRRGTARRAFTPPVGGFLTVRSAKARGDWDLALRDRRTGRVVASQGFGSREVVQSWVRAGQPLTIVACRRSGPARSLRVSTQMAVADLPKPVTASLVRVTGLERADYERLEGLGFDVTHNARDGYADLVATAADAARLTRLGYDFAPKAPAKAAAGGASPLPSGRTTYRVLEDYQAELKELAAKHPDIVKPVVLPKPSFQGRELSGVEIAADVNAADGRPQFLLVALHHAREWPAAEAAMEFAHLLVQGAGKDPRIDRLLRSTRVVVVPLINPDGFVSSRTTALIDPSHNLYENGVDPGVPVCGNLNTCEGVAPPGGLLSFRRKNCDGAIPSGAVPCELQYGVDPNRNYGHNWGGSGSSSDPMGQTYRGTGPWSEPETQAVHEWSQSHSITSMITIHNVAALVLRPPGVKENGLAPDEAALKSLGDAMARATGYKSQFGYQLYDTSGTTEDWNYAAAGTFGYTIEMGPPDGEFHMPYETGVLAEWEGTGSRAGQGLREALLLAAESSADRELHSVIAGRAPAGRTLRVHKDFTTPTKETCAMGATGEPFDTGAEVCTGGTVAAQEVPDKLDYTTVVPASGLFEWHVTPSTRPFVAKAGGSEAWTLTCEQDGKPIETRSVTVARGERVNLDLPCGGTLPSLPAVSVPKPAGSKPAAKRRKARSVCAKARRAKGKQRRKLVKRCKAAKRRAAAKRRRK